MPDIISRCDAADIGPLYQAISQDSKFGHFVRIPERICRCLDYFKVASQRATVRQRLHAYYLFIGVVDDVIDSSQLEAGREILRQLDRRYPCFNDESRQSSSKLVTEVLKCHIDAELYLEFLSKLEELYCSVVRERNSRTIQNYIEERRVVGRMTAELSYLLIRSLLENEREDLCRFLQQVGEVGCLIDSAIDLRADNRLGLLGFNPRVRDHLRIVAIALQLGVRISLKHPRLFSLFLEAVGDNLLDRLRAITRGGTRAAAISVFEDRTDNALASAKTLGDVAWTKL